MRSCTPQKQPPARTARSSLMDVLHLVQVSAVARCFHVVAMDEAERCRVDAVAQSTAVPRTVGKHVAEVAVAVRGPDLGAHHAVCRVAELVDVRWLDRLGEARPSATGLE